MSKILYVLVISILLFGGCVRSHFEPITTTIYKPKPANHDIQVFFEGETPNIRYKVIGLLYAEQLQRGLLAEALPDAVELLKIEGRKCGADGIIGLRITSMRPWTTMWVEGKAIVFEK